MNEPPSPANCILELEVQSAHRLSELAGRVADLLAERMTPEEAAVELGATMMRDLLTFSGQPLRSRR